MGEEKARRKQKEEEEEARTVWMSGKQAAAAPAAPQPDAEQDAAPPLAAPEEKAPTAPRAPTPDQTSSPMRTKSADGESENEKMHLAIKKAKEHLAKSESDATSQNLTQKKQPKQTLTKAERLVKANEYHAKYNTQQIFYDGIKDLGSGSNAIKHYRSDYHGPKWAQNEEGDNFIICKMCLRYGDKNEVQPDGNELFI